MRLKATVFFAVIGFAILFASAAFADGGCEASEEKAAEGALRKAEDAEKTGKTKEAYDAAQTASFVDCAANGSERRYRLIERTGKKLGAEEEKAGRFSDAFKYYYAPYSYRTTYSLADADRAMLKHVKASPDDYKAASQAVDYFKGREGTPHLQEVRALAKRAGDKMLAKEEKNFAVAARREHSLEDLQKAKEWFNLAGEGKQQADARAEQRGDSLLGEGTVRSIELALQYYDFARNKNKGKNAQEHARKLGDEAARKGDHGLAVRFYALSGDKSKLKAAEKEKEKTETKRQDQFKKDQKALEKDLGL